MYVWPDFKMYKTSQQLEGFWLRLKIFIFILCTFYVILIYTYIFIMHSLQNKYFLTTDHSCVQTILDLAKSTLRIHFSQQRRLRIGCQVNNYGHFCVLSILLYLTFVSL